MTREQLEHVIRASAAAVNTRDIIVVGSQAVLATLPEAPAELIESLEADVYPKDEPRLSIVIDGAIGELSMFHSTFGYYAHGVDETTAIVPDGWQQRLVRLETPRTLGAVGWCLEPHDLAVSKLAAAREKDYRFVQAMIRADIVQPELLYQRLDQTPRLDARLRDIVIARLGLCK